jgi:hypothetical protein
LILVALIFLSVDVWSDAAWLPVPAHVWLRGSILGFSALTWVVAHAVFAPGRTTVQRVQGAVVVNLAMILNPAAFNNAIAPGRSGELGTMFISTLLR